MKRSRWLWFLAICYVIPLAWLGWYRWDTARNRGYEFGHYGEFNRISHALSRSGAAISRTWMNDDIQLEEFGFDLTTRDGRFLALAFPEDDPIRKKERMELAMALEERIRSAVGR